MAAKKKKSRPRPPQFLFALFDEEGWMSATCVTRDEAEDDAWGPRFRGGHTIRKYALVKKRDE